MALPEHMTTFRPTRPPPGRLVRLGVVVDPADGAARVRQLATMCERAGVDAAWLRGGETDAPIDVWSALDSAAAATSRVRLGIVLHGGIVLDGRAPLSGALDPATNRADALARRLQALDAGLRSRLEVALVPPAPTTAHRAAVESSAEIEARARVLHGLVSRVSVHALEPPWLATAVRLADDVLLPPGTCSGMRAALTEIAAACGREGRPPDSLGIAADVPVSIGRTAAEARARADTDARFRALGHPGEIGIFGRLEDCQDRVIELAHLGVTDLRCALPRSLDVHDVIAQLTAMVVGSPEVLRPDAVRSRAPDPPAGWGGRR